MNLDNFSKVCVVGWARSGISLCRLLLSLGKKVKISEIKERKCFPASLVNEFGQKGVEFEFGGHSRNFIKDSQLLIVSPGVDTLHSQTIKSYQSQRIPCVGEIEFSSWLTKAKIVAVTGTNGKTTTTYLAHKAIKKRKRRVFLGGNIGTPFSSFVLNTKKGDVVVLEVSSFQLETTFKFRPYVAAFLNIEPDHFDRYGGFRKYFQAKMNIFKNQGKKDWAVLNKNMTCLDSIEKRLKSRILHFGKEFPNENFSCVYRIAKVFGVDRDECQRVFLAFRGLGHRLEFVKNIKGVTFINDSKATNPASTVWALKNTKKKIVLIAGGKDKGLDYSAILDYSDRIRKINLFGEASYKIRKSLNSDIESEMFSSLEEAVRASKADASSGDIVLFSPMCSSFDMFSDYKERGSKFMEIVNSLSK
ncbi:MAG: Mur ligase family protein [Omnitrophica bacterium]|nr:Mur ligase family protein [Candidatus Omnitrophota bacterium]